MIGSICGDGDEQIMEAGEIWPQKGHRGGKILIESSIQFHLITLHVLWR